MQKGKVVICVYDFYGPLKLYCTGPPALQRTLTLQLSCPWEFSVCRVSATCLIIGDRKKTICSPIPCDRFRNLRDYTAMKSVSSGKTCYLVFMLKKKKWNIVHFCFIFGICIQCWEKWKSENLFKKWISF